MMNKNSYLQTRLTFRHNIGVCESEFETKLSIICDHPEKVICPGCIVGTNNNRTAAIKRFGQALSDFLAARQDLESNFNFELVSEI